MPMTPEERAPTGSLDELRETASEQLGLCSFHCALAVDQFAVLADAGAFYNARRSVAFLNAAIGTLKMLHVRLAAEREAALARRPDPMPGSARRGESA